MSLSHRDFLKGMAASVAAVSGVLGSAPARAERATSIMARRNGETYRLDISTTHGYNALRYLMRDVRANVVGYPHYFLAERLAWIQAWYATNHRLEVIDFTSGLRTPKTNGATEGAKQASAHLPNEEMVFFAADWRMRGIDSKHIATLSQDLASFSGFGGTGIYVQRDFVHTDVLRKREWRGQ